MCESLESLPRGEDTAGRGIDEHVRESTPEDLVGEAHSRQRVVDKQIAAHHSVYHQLFAERQGRVSGENCLLLVSLARERSRRNHKASRLLDLLHFKNKIL